MIDNIVHVNENYEKIIICCYCYY